MPDVALFSPDLDPSVDPSQILNNETSALRMLLDQSFGNNVVTVSAETVLPTTKSLEMSLGRIGAFRLQGLPELVDLVAGSGPTPFPIELVIGRYGRTTHTKVNPTVLSDLRGRFIPLDYDMQVRSFVPMDTEVSRTNLPTQPILVVFRYREPDLDASLNGREGGFFTIKPDGTGIGVVPDRLVGPAPRKRSLLSPPEFGPGRLEGLGCFCSSGAN
jgi:hypothetical protein